MRRTPMTAPAMVATWIVGLFAILGGPFITWADDERFVSPGYSLIRGVPGGMDTWGDALAVLGLVVITGTLGRWWALKAVGIVGVSLWCLIFGVVAGATYAQVPNAGPTAIPTYLCLGLLVIPVAFYDTEAHDDAP